MPKHEGITMTLGELIVALSDKVDGCVHDPSGKYAIVSVMLSDLLAHDARRLHRLIQELEQEEIEYRSAS